RNKKEIDFIIKENGKISQLIQVSFSLDDSKTLEREIVALIEASQELYCDDLLIITSNNNQRIERDGKIIKVVSFTNWVMTIGKDLE
ncbi:MAG TPA: ATP-binding protein, partial [Candidatus Paceibacterota bacterium]|nr:ATP-binding protein [Candidatus Paceibacterota bacterium]